MRVPKNWQFLIRGSFTMVFFEWSQLPVLSLDPANSCSTRAILLNSSEGVQSSDLEFFLKN